AALGSVNAPGFAVDASNRAFAAANATLSAGQAGTATQAGTAPAIRAEALRTIVSDPLLEQMIAEEAQRTQRIAAGEQVGTTVTPGHGLQGAGGAKGARQARELEKIREQQAAGKTL
ncbi:MAG: hypothetical protein RR434_03565, partial [Raoultibacter sp.]